MITAMQRALLPGLQPALPQLQCGFPPLFRRPGALHGVSPAHRAAAQTGAQPKQPPGSRATAPRGSRSAGRAPGRDSGVAEVFPSLNHAAPPCAACRGRSAPTAAALRAGRAGGSVRAQGGGVRCGDFQPFFPAGFGPAEQQQAASNKEQQQQLRAGRCVPRSHARFPPRCRAGAAMAGQPLRAAPLPPPPLSPDGAALDALGGASSLERLFLISASRFLFFSE